MGNERPKRPRPAKFRTLPDDAASLVQQIRSIHARFIRRAEHFKTSSHDANARRALVQLHDQRTLAWQKLQSLEPMTALALTGELGATHLPEMEVTP